ncbi:hypothetical protein D3C86_1331110 [compost metagenome]
MVLGDAFGTAAERTEALAERQVDIDADAFGSIAFAEGFLEGLHPRFITEIAAVPIGHGRIARVPRARDIVFLDKGMAWHDR